MINKETIISVYNEKLTLLQWLKSVNKALDEAVLTNVEIEQRGNATFVFVFTFEDGTKVESNEIVVNKGDSVESANIVNGHLILTLTNDNTIDAGNIKPVSSFGFDPTRHLIVYYGDGTSQDLGLIKGVSGFSFNSSRHLIVTYDNGTTEDLGLIKGVSGFSINSSQHLIVTYDNGTTEDLGAIFDGNITIDGTLTATRVDATRFDGTLVTGDTICEKMVGYSFAKREDTEYLDYTYNYASVVKNGNKITFAVFGSVKKLSGFSDTNINLGVFTIPSAIGEKLYPVSIGGLNTLGVSMVSFATSLSLAGQKVLPVSAYKNSDTQISLFLYSPSELTTDTKYTFRFEITFLLSENMAV